MATSSWAGTAPCTCFTSSVHVHTSTVPDATTNTLSTVSVPSCLTRQLTPFRASAGSTPHTHKALGCTLTPFIRLQLCLQVFRGYVEFCLLTLRCFGLAFPTAAVKATAQTAAAVAAGEEATDNKQRLGERENTDWHYGASRAHRPYHKTLPAEDRSRATVYTTNAKGIFQEKAVDKRELAG